MIKYNPISRRMFLQGTAGFLSIPLLPSLLPEAQAQAASNNGMRFAMVLSNYGRDLDNWITAPINLTRSPDNSYGYQALTSIQGNISHILGSSYDAALRRKIAIIRGMDCMDGISAHNSHFATTSSATDPSEAKSFGYSIDAVLEESSKFYPNPVAMRALRVVPNGPFSSYSYTSRSQRGQPLPYERDVKVLYNKFFSPAGVQTLTTRNAFMGSVINSVYASFTATMASRKPSTVDKQRLDQYMQYLSQAERNLKTPLPNCPSPTVTNYTTTTQMQNLAFDLEVAALACGMTKIVMHALEQYNDDVNTSLGSETWHANAHGPSSQSYGVWTKDINKFHMDLFASFLKKLDSVMDADGNTLLDNTVVMFGNDDSSGAHWSYDYGLIMAGGKGKIQTNQLIDYRSLTRKTDDGYSHPLGRPYGDYLVTGLKACGLGAADYQVFPGQQGFGIYDNYDPRYAAHYQPYLTATSRNAGLPGLYIG